VGGTVLTVPFRFLEKEKEGISHRGHSVKITEAAEKSSARHERPASLLWRADGRRALQMLQRQAEGEISTGAWRICNFGLRIADMKRRVGLCLVAFLPA
jgi:hypothetical protein